MTPGSGPYQTALRVYQAFAIRTGFWKGSAAVSIASSTAAPPRKTFRSASLAFEPCGSRVSKFTAATYTEIWGATVIKVSGKRGKLVSQSQRSPFCSPSRYTGDCHALVHRDRDGRGGKGFSVDVQASSRFDAAHLYLVDGKRNRPSGCRNPRSRRCSKS